MRNLAALYLEFKNRLPEDTTPSLDLMFDRDYWKALTESIEAITTKQDSANGVNIK